jgi:hypothetical protein
MFRGGAFSPGKIHYRIDIKSSISLTCLDLIIGLQVTIV